MLGVKFLRAEFCIPLAVFLCCFFWFCFIEKQSRAKIPNIVFLISAEKIKKMQSLFKFAFIAVVFLLYNFAPIYKLFRRGIKASAESCAHFCLAWF